MWSQDQSATQNSSCLGMDCQSEESKACRSPSRISGLQNNTQDGTSQHGSQDTSSQSEDSIDVPVDYSGTGQWHRQSETGLEFQAAVIPEEGTSTKVFSSMPEIASAQCPDKCCWGKSSPINRFGNPTGMHDNEVEKLPISNTTVSPPVKIPEEETGKSVFKFLKWKREQLTESLTPHWPLDGFLAKTFTRAVVVLLSYGAAWAILGDDILPCSLLFSFSLLILLSATGGFLARILYLPPLVGMIVVGFLFNNIPKVNCNDNPGNGSTTANNSSIACGIEEEKGCYDLDDDWASILRSIALVIILTRAGLSLDAGNLRKMKCLVARLAFLPSLAEASVEAVAVYLLLDMPWIWAFMTGFVMAAISPAVVVLGLLGLQAQGYGTAQGIPTLLIAAATGDDVLDISGFGIFLGIALAEGSLIFNVFRAPIELVLGLTWGCLFGVVSWWLPSHDKSQGYKSRNRLVYLFACGLLTVFGGKNAGFTGAGALGVVVMAFVASSGWKTEKVPVDRSFKILWEIAQPALFGLTGAAVDIDFLSANVIGMGLATLAVGLLVRLTVTYLVVAGQGFTVKERIFIALAWLPKATVQAAIGSIAYETAKEEKLGKEEELGKKLLTVSFLVIVVCAPVGAAAIQFSGPWLLRKESAESGINKKNGQVSQTITYQETNV